jgi:hypothetical protein
MEICQVLPFLLSMDGYFSYNFTLIVFYNNIYTCPLLNAPKNQEKMLPRFVPVLFVRRVENPKSDDW